MTELDDIIHALIRREGPISVARYMQLALQHPEFGYYVKGDPLGVAGDFTTSPEISQIFGELVGLWIADLWRRSEKPKEFVLLELGAGRGTLMEDALRAAVRVTGFRDGLRLHLLESNETLRSSQKEKLGAFDPRFIHDVGQLPALPVFAIANEFFDALPVHQYVRKDGVWHERLVGLVDEKLAFVLGGEALVLPLPEGADFLEVSPQSVAIVQQLSAHIAQHGGGALLIDYGYAQPAGGDTLQAVSGHASVPPLQMAGRVDLTAHVDFAALKIAAEKQGCHVPDVVTQGSFLQALGIDIRASQLKLKATETQAREIGDAVRRLTDPYEMGSVFKVMALVPPTQKEISGFS